MSIPGPESVGQSIERVFEFAACRRGRNTRDGLASHHAAEQFVADPGQQGVGQDRVDHAAAAFQFGATVGDQFDHGLVVAERNGPGVRCAGGGIQGQTAVPFVELRPAPLATTPAPARGPEVELVGVQGERMVIRLAAGQHLDLPALAKAFQGRWA